MTTDSGHSDQRGPTDDEKEEDGKDESTLSLIQRSHFLMCTHVVIITCDEDAIIDDVSFCSWLPHRRLSANKFPGAQSHSCSPSGWVFPPCTYLVTLCRFQICSCRILQAIFDTAHSGTLLDLPHYHCNNVYVPWQSKGEHRTRSRHNWNGSCLHHVSLSSTLTAA